MPIMHFLKRHIPLLLLLLCSPSVSAEQALALPRPEGAPCADSLRFVPCRQVQLADLFWRKRLHAIADVTLPTLLRHAPRRGAQRQAFLSDAATIADNVSAFDPDNAVAARLADSLHAISASALPPVLPRPVDASVADAASLTGDVQGTLSDALRHAELFLQLFLQSGDGRYVDRFERTLFNSLLCSYHHTGDSFYTLAPQPGKPLPPRRPCSARAEAELARLTRLLSGITGTFCATGGRHVYVNFYTRGTVAISTDSLRLSLFEQSSYPWAGDAGLAVMCQQPQRFTLHLRVPQWLSADSLEGSVGCRYLDAGHRCSVTVNGRRVDAPLSKGYLTIDRLWSDSDFVVVRFPMDIRRVVDASGTHTALQRGPLVYAVEDSTGCLTAFFDNRQTLHTEFRKRFLDNVQTISGTLAPTRADAPAQPFTAIPYYAIGSRAKGETFGVWMNSKP
jgi:hypothetical protein